VILISVIAAGKIGGNCQIIDFCFFTLTTEKKWCQRNVSLTYEGRFRQSVE